MNAAGPPLEPGKPGRPRKAPEQVQSAIIRERVTEAQRAEYEARGAKAWLVRELAQKAPQAVPNAETVASAASDGEGRMNIDLMREVMLRVGEHLEAVGVKLSPAKFAHLVLFIYADAIEKGSASNDVIHRAVQLAK